MVRHTLNGRCYEISDDGLYAAAAVMVTFKRYFTTSDDPVWQRDLDRLALHIGLEPGNKHHRRKAFWVARSLYQNHKLGRHYLEMRFDHEHTSHPVRLEGLIEPDPARYLQIGCTPECQCWQHGPIPR